MVMTFCGFVHADIVVVSYVDMPDISKKMAKQIFLKKVTELPNGMTVTPIDLKDGESIKWEFYKSIAGKRPSQIYAYWSRSVFSGGVSPPEQVNSVSALKIRLQNEPGTVGYMNADDATSDMTVLLRINS